MKILFLSRWFPYPPDNGSKIRIWNLLRQLSRRHAVSLVSFHELGQAPSGDALAQVRAVCSTVTAVEYRPYRPRGARAIAGFLSPSPRYLVDTYGPEMQAAVEERVSRDGTSLIVASQLSMIPYVIRVSGVPALLEELELTSFLDATHRGIPAARRWRARLTWLKLSRFLRHALPRFSACTVVSELERDNLARILPAYDAVHVLPNAVEMADYEGDFGPPVPRTLLFSGALTYDANYDALSYFLQDIFPRVLAQEPTASLAVTGNNRTVDLSGLPSYPGVTFTGYLPDIRPAVAQSWVSVVPLRVGGGTRLKILESMALGTPVVSTPKGAEGLEVADGKNILLANDPSEFAEMVTILLRSSEMRERIVAAGRTLVEARYSWRVVGSKLDALVDSTRWAVA